MVVLGQARGWRRRRSVARISVVWWQVAEAFIGHRWLALLCLAVLVFYPVWCRIQNCVKINCQKTGIGQGPPGRRGT